jgi:CelD/BcsL family acetyltransferase involved in cellulose biosynthesis
VPPGPGPPALAVTGGDDPGWRQFLASHPEATVFHHPAWSRVLTESYGYRSLVLLQRGRDETVVGGVPLLELPGSRRGRRFVSLPFTDYCPPLTTTAAGLSQLTSNLAGWLTTSGARQLTVHGELPATSGIQVVMRGLRHVLPLQGSSEQVRARINGSPVHRAIKKAQREGVVATLSRSADDLETFYRLHLQTRRRQGVPVQPKRFLQLLHKHVIAEGLGFLVLAHLDRRPVAGALFLAWNGNLIYKFGASDPRFWELRPNNLVMWEAINWACEHRYRQLDFGRTELDNRGLREFKSRWGAHELPLMYSHLPPARPGSIPRVVMQAMARVIQSSPPIVCRVTGELLYGRLPGLAS